MGATVSWCMKNTGRGERTALGRMLTAMMRIIQGEIGLNWSENILIHCIIRNEYPDEEENSSDEDGSYGGYCDEDGLTSGVRGLKKCSHFEYWNIGIIWNSVILCALFNVLHLPKVWGWVTVLVMNPTPSRMQKMSLCSQGEVSLLNLQETLDL